MKNRHLKVANFSEGKFRLLAKCFAQDLPATKATLFCGLNCNTVQRVYTLLRARILALCLAEIKLFAGEIEVDESYFGPTRICGKKGARSGGENSCSRPPQTR